MAMTAGVTQWESGGAVASQVAGSTPAAGPDDPVLVAVFYGRCFRAALDAIPTGQLHIQSRYDMQDEIDRMVAYIKDGE